MLERNSGNRQAQQQHDSADCESDHSQLNASIPIALRITALYPLSQLLLAGHCTKTSDGVNDGIATPTYVTGTFASSWHHLTQRKYI
jgi:hypothetical protein